MKNDFDHIMNAWHAIDYIPNCNYEQTREHITRWRTRRKRNILLWAVTVIAFSTVVVGYVVYTDELNSINKSISEIILLGTAIYLFVYSLRRIINQKKEFLLDSVEFIKNLPLMEIKEKRKGLLTWTIVSSCIIIAAYFYFLDVLLLSQDKLIVISSLGLAVLSFLWLKIKPTYERSIAKTRQKLSDKASDILRTKERL